LSGAVSHYGLSIQQGVEAYVGQVNAAGGINGHKIKLTSLDSAGNQSQAAADATQLASADQVDAIFGNALSSDCTGAQSAADRYQVPLACLSVDTPDPYVPCSGAQLKTALEKLNVSLPGLVASYAFTSSNHYPYTSWYVYHAVGTKTTLIDTLPAGTGT
jgi:hypothetical protein